MSVLLVSTKNIFMFELVVNNRVLKLEFENQWEVMYVFFVPPCSCLHVDGTILDDFII